MPGLCLTEVSVQSACVWCAQIEVGQLDSTIAVSNVPLGNMSYWFEGTSIVITLNLTAGMLSKPLGLFVNKTSPPTAPPSQLDTRVSPAAEQGSCCQVHDKTGLQCNGSGAANKHYTTPGSPRGPGAGCTALMVWPCIEPLDSGV